MSSEIEERHHSADRHIPNFTYRVLSMHDNPILPIFHNPERLLAAPRLEVDQRICEKSFEAGRSRGKIIKTRGSERE